MIQGRKSNITVCNSIFGIDQRRRIRPSGAENENKIILNIGQDRMKKGEIIIDILGYYHHITVKKVSKLFLRMWNIKLSHKHDHNLILQELQSPNPTPNSCT